PELSAAPALQHPERLLDQDLPFHDRQAPVALPSDHLARLEPVTEHAQRPPDREPIGRTGKAVEAGRGGAGEHRLSEPDDQLLWEALLIHREKQHADPRSLIRRLGGRELPLDSRLALAADHRRREPRELDRRLPSPLRGPPRDHDPRHPHRERFSERIRDRDAVDLHATGSAPEFSNATHAYSAKNPFRSVMTAASYGGRTASRRPAGARRSWPSSTTSVPALIT